MAGTARLLVVDDDSGFRSAVASFAEPMRMVVDQASTLAEARKAMGGRVDLLLLDLGLPDGSGVDLLSDGGLDAGHIAIVTGQQSIASSSLTAVARASEFLVKPVPPQALKSLLHRVASETGAQPVASASAACGAMIGASPAMREVFTQIRKVAPTGLTVMLVGETGTGKELAARALHSCSGRAGEFVAVNCGAMSPELLASELFGHERGSFTGASRQHNGCFERADGGTVFLDEITEMPLAMQTHLLRVLETRTIVRVGGEQERELSLAVIAACNRDPLQAVREGRLREDLLYRLMDFPIRLPPLRERGDDAIGLARAMLARLNEEHGWSKRFAHGTEALLLQHSWPGNVRELQHAVRRGFLLAEDAEVRLSLLSAGGEPAPAAAEGLISFPVGTPLEELTRAMLLRTLAHYGNDKTRTARALGVSVKTVYNHLQRIRQAPSAGSDR